MKCNHTAYSEINTSNRNIYKRKGNKYVTVTQCISFFRCFLYQIVTVELELTIMNNIVSVINFLFFSDKKTRNLWICYFHNYIGLLLKVKLNYLNCSWIIKTVCHYDYQFRRIWKRAPVCWMTWRIKVIEFLFFSHENFYRWSCL